MRIWRADRGRIGEKLPRYLEEGRPPFPDWYNWAYVLESLPCALWCFLASPEDFEQSLFTAVDAGHDADTIAAMACSVSGAFHGYSRLPRRFLADLENHGRLIELADGLYESTRRRSELQKAGGRYSDLTSSLVQRNIGRRRDEKSPRG